LLFLPDCPGRLMTSEDPCRCRPTSRRIWCRRQVQGAAALGLPLCMTSGAVFRWLIMSLLPSFCLVRSLHGSSLSCRVGVADPLLGARQVIVVFLTPSFSLLFSSPTHAAPRDSLDEPGRVERDPSLLERPLCAPPAGHAKLHVNQARLSDRPFPEGT